MDESRTIAERATLAILGIAVLVIWARLPGRPGIFPAFLLHLGLLAGFGLASGVFARTRWPFLRRLRPLAVVVVMFTLYTTLGVAGFRVMPWTGDAMLFRADQLLFGAPELFAARHMTLGRVEALSFFYGLFLPVLYLSIFFGIAGRPERERDEFFTGFALLYAASFLGYLLLPSRGPIESLAGVLPRLPGGHFHDLILRSVASTGGNLGAFPSLHVGATAYTILFDRRHDRLRALTYLPLLALIGLATICLRYHYAVDLAAGLALALAAAAAARRLHGDRAGGLGGRQVDPRVSAGVASEASVETWRPPSPTDRGAWRADPLWLWWRAALAVWFRRIEVEGLENVPSSGAVILVPNHVNALVDPLVVMTRLRRPVALTAKRALEKNPLLALVMTLMRVVRLQRPQDGDPAGNAAAFAECHRRLAAGEAICIFPEGLSHSDPKMRPFKTGAARMALSFPGPVTIVPVGLHYDSKETWRSTVHVRFGAPMTAQAGGDARSLTAEIEARVRALTLEFERRHESALLGWAADVLLTGAAAPAALGRDRDAPALAERIALVRRLRDAYPTLQADPRVPGLSRRVRAWRSELVRRGITPAEVFLEMDAARAAFFVLREAELLGVGLPVAAWGALQHAPIALTLRAIARALSKDRDHWASNSVVPSVLVVPVFYAIQIALALLLLPLPWAIVYAATLPFAGWYAVLYRDRAGSTVRRTRTFVRFLFDRGLQRRLAAEGRALVEEIRALEPGERSIPADAAVFAARGAADGFSSSVEGV
jgi:glycerol-3-phosphate O-acyltransferase/dihydroxyacetone phosphate acyltransferase